MRSDTYSMSFSTGGLFQRESLKLASLYLKLSDWSAVRDEAISGNLLQARTSSTLTRVYREVVSRLETLTPLELRFLVEASRQEQGYLLWVAVCRRYRFIGDFAVEVIRERFITLKGTLGHEEFDIFFHRKSEWHAELDAIRPATRNKLRQVLFKILREADILNESNLINAAILSPGLLDLISRVNRQDVLFFPAFDSDLKRTAS